MFFARSHQALVCGMHEHSGPSLVSRAARLLRRLISHRADLQRPAPEPQPVLAGLQCDSANDRVNWVAAAVADPDAFRDRACIAANELGPTRIEHLATLFHAEHSPPAEYAMQFQGLGGWMMARQFAIFEIFYNFGGDAIPLLQRVAYGEYDWTQGNAIEILCRLAADGMQAEQIVAGLAAHLPAMREEAHYYALGPLLSYAQSNQALMEVLSQLLSVPEFKQSHDHLVSSQSAGL